MPALSHFTMTLGDAQTEWQKVQMKGKVRSSSAYSSWHCFTTHSRADVLWFPSVISEAPHQQGGAFFHPFPSTFASHSLLGFFLKHRIPHELTQGKHMFLMYSISLYISSVIAGRHCCICKFDVSLKARNWRTTFKPCTDMTFLILYTHQTGGDGIRYLGKHLQEFSKSTFSGLGIKTSTE